MKTYFDSEQTKSNQRQIEADIAHSKATGRWSNLSAFEIANRIPSTTKGE